MLRVSYILPILMLACSGENILEKQANSAPTILIASHSDGVEVQDGYIESFRAIVSDDDNEFDELSIAWYIAEEIVCDWTEASLSGESYCEILFEEGDENVIAEVRDPQGSGARHEIAIVVIPTEAPLIELLTPISETNYYSDQLIQFSALVSDAEDDAEDLLISWTSGLDGELSLSTAVSSNGEISDYTYLTEGNHAIELRVEDASGKVSTEEVVIQVGGENNIPTCAIIEPIDGASVVVGETVTFRATVADPDVAANELQVEWLSNNDGLLGTATPTSSGDVLFITDSLSNNVHAISLIVTDDVGAVCSEQLVLNVGTPPAVTIDQPLDGDVFSLGDAISFQGTVIDQEDLPNELSLTWTSNLDGELYAGNPNSQGISQFSTANLNAGLHSLTLSVIDSFGLFADDIVSFRVNTPPVVDVLSLSPDPIYSNDSLSISVTSTDADGDTVIYSYLWFENGIQTSFIGTTINAVELDVGEEWTVRVTPNDGYTDGNYAEESIFISNTLPVISSATINSSNSPNTFIDSTLTCSATASDLDEVVTVSYSWTVNGASYTGSSLALSTISLSPNDIVECLASVSDSNGGTASSTATITIDNQAPSVSAVTITPNTGVLTNTELTCSATISDPEEGSLTPSYEWFIGGVSAGNSSIIQLDNALVSPTDAVECLASAIDSNGATDSASSTITVDNSTPVVDTISLSPSSVSPFDEITCSASSSDIDGDIPTLIFAFENLTTGTSYTSSSSTIADATLDLSTTTILPNDELQCTVTASDSNTGQTTDSTSTIISWDQPTISVIAQGNTYRTGDILSCSGTATDNQGNDISSSIQFQWINTSNSNVILSSQSAYTIDVNDTDVGDNLKCTGAVTDQFGYTASSDSTIIPVENTPPSFLTGPEISDYSPEEGDIITCSFTAEDIDLDNIQVTYEWYNTTNASLITTGQQYTVNDTQGTFWSAEVGDEINCTVSLFDGTDTVTQSSPNATIENGAPAISNLTITPNTGVVTGTALICSATVIDSTDGDLTNTNNVTYSWTVNGSTVSTQNTYTVDASETDVGDNIECSVTAIDFEGEISTDSTSVILDNSLALFASSQINPSPAYNDSTLICSTTLTDVDEPTLPLTPIVIWQQNGSVIDPSLTSDTIDLSLYSILPQDTISCLLNYTDGNQGAATDSISVSIENRLPPTPSIQIDPAMPIVGIDDLLCDISSAPLDDDGDQITYTFSWTKNGSPHLGSTLSINYTDDTIPFSEGSLNDLWECTVTPNDGFDDGIVATASATIRPPFTGSGSWTNSSGTLPSISTYHSAIFDENNARVLMYGGQSYYQLNAELFEYDTASQSWSVRGTSGITVPSLSQASSAYDNATSQWFIFGGESYYTLSEELYVLDTSVNAETWDSWPAISNAPEARRGGAAVIDENNGLFYVIGGQGYYALLADLWVLDIGNSSNAGASWSEIVGSGTAPTRTNSASGFDAVNATIYLFGGQEYYKLSDTTACFDTITEAWSYPSFTGDSIPPMHSATVTWSDYIGGFIISGGQSYYQLLDSVYVLIPDGACSGEVTEVSISSGSIEPHMGASLVQDTINQESILIGGQSYYQLLDIVSHFNL